MLTNLMNVVMNGHGVNIYLIKEHLLLQDKFWLML